MMLLGFLFLHKEECLQASCPLKHNNALYQPLTDQTTKRDVFPSQDKILHQHFVQSIYSDFERAHANNLSSQHHASYAQFLFYQIGNVHMALIELGLAAKLAAGSL